MRQVIEFQREDGPPIYVEVEGAQSGADASTPSAGGEAVLATRAGDKVIEEADRTFESALGTVTSGAEGILGALRELSAAPKEVSVEFGITLNAEAKVFALAALGAEAYFKVTLTWAPPDPAEE